MISIRRASARDADLLSRLSAAAAREEGGHSALEPEFVRAHGFGAQPLFEAWVAEDRASGRIVGHAIATKGYDVRAAVATVVLAELFVVLEHRGDGLARRLLSAVSARAMDLGAKELMITTGVENTIARAFFASVGALEQTKAVYIMEAAGIEWLAAEGA